MTRNLRRPDPELLECFSRLVTARDVARLLEVSYPDLTWHLYRRGMSTNYRSFEIQKRAGGSRRIAAPISPLKILQAKLAHVLQLVYRVRRPVHGFALGRSIVSNAKHHVGKSFVLNVDLERFFPSINFGRVRGMLMATPYNVPERAATVLAHMCCFENELPQGAPTSPVVSNMVCGKLDSELHRLARRNRCVYTRYADDLSFSPWNPSVSRFPSALAKIDFIDNRMDVQLGDGLKGVIEDAGFRINLSKVRLMRGSKSQIVTGLQVNSHVNVRQRWLRDLRGLLHAWEKYGLRRAEEVFHRKYWRKRANVRSGDNGGPPLDYVVAGKLAFLRQVRGHRDPRYRWLCNWYDRLRGEKERFRFVPCRESADAVWVVETEDRKVCRNRQGTAFLVEDVGFVTCNHVVKDVERIWLFRPDSENSRFEAVVDRSDSHRDIALLSAAGVPPSASLSLGDRSSGQVGDLVQIPGYPDYAPGAQLSSLEARVTEVRVELCVEKIRFETAILAGRSGAPVVDATGVVIGIAERGAPDVDQGQETTRHNAIHVRELLAMIAEGV